VNSEVVSMKVVWVCTGDSSTAAVSVVYSWEERGLFNA
jgi:hypothetical protein